MDDMLVKNSTVLYFSLLALGVFVCGLLSFLSLRSQKDLAPKAGRLTLVEIAFAACFAFVGAVLGGFLMLFSYIRATGIGRFFTALNPEQLSFLCGGAGAALGVFLAAKLFRVQPLRLLNSFAPAGAFMVAVARFAEGFLEHLGTRGFPDPETALPFPLAVAFDFFGDGSYVEYELAVFMFEGFAALIILLFALRWQTTGSAFRRTVFYLCLAQILLESLRSTAIAWLFVKVEQLGCFLVVLGILVWLSFRLKGQKNRWLPTILGLVLCAAVIVIEFALDGKISFMDWPKPVLYGVMSLFLAAVAAAEISASRRLS